MGVYCSHGDRQSGFQGSRAAFRRRAVAADVVIDDYGIGDLGDALEKRTGFLDGKQRRDGDDDAVSGALVSLTQCATAPSSPATPVADRCSTTWLAAKFVRQSTTGSDGKYSFGDLPEGVYEITTSGTETTPATSYWLLRVKGNLDQVTADFVVS